MVTTRRLEVQTQGNGDVVDITSRIAKELSNSGMSSGLATVFVVGSTAGVSTIEYEDRLLSDFRDMWDRLVPRNIPYQHSLTWGDGNGHSHVRASMLGPSLTIPFANKKLTLGTWQQVVLVDFDNRPRSREIVLQLLGEMV